MPFKSQDQISGETMESDNTYSP